MHLQQAYGIADYLLKNRPSLVQWRQYWSFLHPNTKWPLYLNKTIFLQWEVLLKGHFFKYHKLPKRRNILSSCQGTWKFIFKKSVIFLNFSAHASKNIASSHSCEPCKRLGFWKDSIMLCNFQDITSGAVFVLEVAWIEHKKGTRNILTGEQEQQLEQVGRREQSNRSGLQISSLMINLRIFCLCHHLICSGLMSSILQRPSCGTKGGTEPALEENICDRRQCIKEL